MSQHPDGEVVGDGPRAAERADRGTAHPWRTGHHPRGPCRQLGALALYRGGGFAVEGRHPGYYPDGEDALLLWQHEPHGARDGGSPRDPASDIVTGGG
ncbi:MAG: hypothetical protein EA340_04365 [Nitriliruptor sp.]|nr:MAG: hypothetical protein EA340_04365 [Nitriliruptor sp.]